MRHHNYFTDIFARKFPINLNVWIFFFVKYFSKENGLLKLDIIEKKVKLRDCLLTNLAKTVGFRNAIKTGISSCCVKICT